MLIGGFYPSANIQSVYPTAAADWAFINFQKFGLVWFDFMAYQPL